MLEGDGTYKVLFKSEEPFIDLTNESIKIYEKVVIKDSLFDFFPYAEVFVRDIPAAFIEHGLFVEGLKFNLQLGNDSVEDNYLDGNYVWTESQGVDTETGTYLAGTNVFILLSEHYGKDSLKSAAYSQVPAGDAVRTIVGKDYQMSDAKKLFISKTSLPNNWRQMNMTTSMFLQNIAKECTAIANPLSPVVSFINAAGEFYFQSFEEMFQQEPVATFKMTFSENTVVDPESIQEYDIVHVGMPLNHDNYRRMFYKRDELGETATEEDAINNHVVNVEKGKILIRAKDQADKISDYFNLGLCEIGDEELQKGNINSLYRDSALPLRMNITVLENKKLISGKIVNLELESSDEQKITNTEFSGKWLIMESTHYVDNEGFAYANLLIGKSTIKVSKDHKFNADFL